MNTKFSINNRKLYIDLCKAYAICFMIWGHSGIPENVAIYMHSFHMPIFFFISGMLFNKKSYRTFRSFFIRKFKGLIVPYIIFGIINAFICYIIYDKYKFIEQLKAIFTTPAINLEIANALWFLPCIFIVEIAFYFISENKNIYIYIFLFSVTGYLYPQVTSKRLFWGMDIAFVGIVFYGVGYIFNNKIKNYKFKNRFQEISILGILFIINVFTTFMNKYIDLRTIQYNNYFLFYISTMSGIIFYVLLFKYIESLKNITYNYIIIIMQYIGKNTIVFLVLNQFIIHTLDILNNKDFFIRGWGIICSLCTIVLGILFSYLLNRYCPIMIGKSKR